MTKQNDLVLYRIPTKAGTVDPGKWISEGRVMAQTDPVGVPETIDVTHSAEAATHAVMAKQLDAEGAATHAHWTAIQGWLKATGFDPADHLHQLAAGKLDLVQALLLLIVGATLTVFVLYAYAPLWLTLLLGFLVLASATTVEEFFEAHQEKVPLREGIFLTLAGLALCAQFWLGTLRGMLLGALAPATVGPATQALGIGASVLRYTLGIFSLVAEVLAGYKLWRARTALLSPTAQAVRECERYELKMLALGDAMERAKVEAEIRRYYRRIGARKEVARAAGEEGRRRANHLKRAFKGAVIALALLALLLFLAGHASAAPVGSQHKAILLDLSRSQTVQDLKANIDATSTILGQVRPGDHIIVLGIGSEFGRPHFLLNEVMPRDAGHYGLQGQASRETIIANWRQASKDLKPTFPATDIFGAFSTLSYLSDFEPRGAQIYILSDMQQSTAEFDLEHIARVPVEQVMAKLKRVGGIPSLKGAQITVLGVDPIGKSRAYFSTLREFWSAYFRESGAELRVFAIDRPIPVLNRIR